MFHYTFKIEFVTLVSLKVPSGGRNVRTYSTHMYTVYGWCFLAVVFPIQYSYCTYTYVGIGRYIQWVFLICLMCPFYSDTWSKGMRKRATLFDRPWSPSTKKG